MFQLLVMKLQQLCPGVSAGDGAFSQSSLFLKIGLFLLLRLCECVPCICGFMKPLRGCWIFWSWGHRSYDHANMSVGNRTPSFSEKAIAPAFLYIFIIKINIKIITDYFS